MGIHTRIFLTPALWAGLNDCTNRHGCRRTDHFGCFKSSGNRRWCARLRVRAGTGGESFRREFGPHYTFGIAIERYRGRGLRPVDRRAGLQHAAYRTAAVMRAMRSWVGLAGSGIPIAMANDGAGERIGGCDAGCPACADGRNNLHHQRNQDYRQIILQPVHRKTIQAPNLITLRVRSRDQVPGTMLPLQGRKPAKIDAFWSVRVAPYGDTKLREY